MRISDCSSDVCSSDLVCNSRKISKAPMAPSIGRSKSAQAADEVKQKAVMMKALRELRDHVEKSADYVGDKFAEEARKIHYGEADERNIYGETSKDEAEALAEESIDVAMIPWVPRGDAYGPAPYFTATIR